MKYLNKPLENTTQPVQTKSNSVGFQLDDHRATSGLQRKQAAALSNKETPEIVQKKTNATGLPDQLKSGIENLSGHAMDDVKVHYNSSQPAQLNAHAYAQGNQIHLAPGQEKHLQHEAWHVIQQKQGRVKPTMQMKGKVNVNDDKGLENEADVMGAKALQMKDNPLKVMPVQQINLPSKIAQRKPGDFAKMKVGDVIRYKILSSVKTGRIEEITEEGIVVGGAKLPRTTIESPVFTFGVIPEGGELAPLTAAARPVKKAPASIDDHLVSPREFRERFVNGNHTPLTLSVVTAIARKTKGVGENFTCDPFAESLQEQLKVQGITFTPLLIVIDNSETGTEPAVKLHDKGHEYDGRPVGIDSHIATIVLINGLSYVFDNHNPQGVPLSLFVDNLEFLIQYAETKGEEKPKISHAELVGRNKIKVFVMTATKVRSSRTSWRASLLQSTKFDRVFGTNWTEFSALAKRENDEVGFREIRLPKLRALEVGSGEFVPNLHHNYEVMIATQHEMIIQQLKLIQETKNRRHDFTDQVALLKDMQALMLEMTDAQLNVQKQFVKVD